MGPWDDILRCASDAEDISYNGTVICFQDSWNHTAWNYTWGFEKVLGLFKLVFKKQK